MRDEADVACKDAVDRVIALLLVRYAHHLCHLARALVEGLERDALRTRVVVGEDAVAAVLVYIVAEDRTGQLRLDDRAQPVGAMHDVRAARRSVGDER